MNKRKTNRFEPRSARFSNGTVFIRAENSLRFINLPPDTPGRREFHITLLSPPELVGLLAEERAKFAQGLSIAGESTSGEVVRHDIGDTPGYQLTVTWDAAQELRKSLGLPPKETPRQPQRRDRRSGLEARRRQAGSHTRS